MRDRYKPSNCGFSGKACKLARRNQQTDLSSVIPAQAISRMINRTPFGPRCLRLSKWSWHSHSGFTTRNATTITSKRQETIRCLWLKLIRGHAWMEL